MSVKRSFSRFELPHDLQELPKENLIGLIHTLVKERNALQQELETERAAKKPKLSVNTVLAASVPPASVTPTASNVAAIKKRMGKALVNAVKKAAHSSNNKKPATEVSEGGMSPEMAQAIFGHLSPKSDTKRMTKWHLHNDTEIASLLSCDRLVHPVKHDGKGLLFFGGRPRKIYGWAGFDQMEIKYDKRDQALQLKIRSYCVGVGPPEYRPGYVAYSKGQTNILAKD